MAKLVVVSPASFGKCASCAEQIRPCEKRIRVMEGKRSEGTYCARCEKYARLNHDVDDIDDSGKSERMMEHFADCQAAGMSREAAFADWDYTQGANQVW